MNIGIVGLGLMGGSFCRTLKRSGEHVVYGIDASARVMAKAELMKAIDFVLTIENAKELDMIVFAVYPDAFKKVAEEFLPHLKDGAVVTDFCGIKRGIVRKMKGFSKDYPSLVFVGGHPMAGREFSGIEHSTAGLFERASMILVPVNADIFALDSVKKFFLSLGFSRVEITTADNHDETIAYTSQLCHVISNAYVKNEQAEKHAGYSAGSFRDLSRVARLNPEMWAGLMTENADKLKPELDEFIANLQKYSEALGKGDGEGLKKLLSEGNERKIAIDFRSTKKD